jgi:hypothetical protein
VKLGTETYAVAHLLEELDLLRLERSHGDGFDMVLELATVLCVRTTRGGQQTAHRGNQKKNYQKSNLGRSARKPQLTTAGEAEGESRYTRYQSTY